MVELPFYTALSGCAILEQRGLCHKIPIVPRQMVSIMDPRQCKAAQSDPFMARRSEIASSSIMAILDADGQSGSMEIRERGLGMTTWIGRTGRGHLHRMG